MLSGSVCSSHPFDTTEESLRKGNLVAKNVGCSGNGRDLLSDTAEVIRCLRLKSVEELVHAASGVGHITTVTFLPSFYDKVLPRNPSVAMKRGFFNKADVIVGITSDEGAFDLLRVQHPLLNRTLQDIDQASFDDLLIRFLSMGNEVVVPEVLKHYEDQVPPGCKEARRRVYVDYRSDRLYNCQMQYFAELYSRRGHSVYRYIFGHKYAEIPYPQWIGVPHSRDFRCFFAAPLSTGPSFTEEDLTVSDHLAHIVASFARNG